MHQPSNTAGERSRPRKIRRRGIFYYPLRHYGPAVVWLAAIAAAVVLYDFIDVAGSAVGYAVDESVSLAHLEEGVVRDVHIELHQRVKPSQVLVTMDDRDERLHLASIQKEIEKINGTIEAEAARMQADNSRSLMEGEDLERRFLIDRETAHMALLNARVQQAHDQIQLRGARRELEHIQSLHDTGRAPFRELNNALTLVDSLDAKIQQHADVIKEAEWAFDETDRRWAEFAKRDTTDIAMDPVLSSLRMAAAAVEAELAERIFEIDAHVLRSPVEGQVTRILVQPGDYLPAGTTLVEVSPIMTDRVVAYLPENRALAQVVGTPVIVRRAARSAQGAQELEGRIASLSAVVNEAPPRFARMGTQTMWGRELVIVLNDGPLLMPGEAVTVRFGSSL